MSSIETTRASTARWEGPDGLRQLGDFGRVAVPDPERFHATWRSIHVEGVAVGEWTTTPIAGALPPNRDSRSVALLILERGSLAFWTGEQPSQTRPGAVHLVSGGRPIRFSVPERTRVLCVTVPTAFIPAHRLGTALDVAKALEPSRLIAGLTSIVQQVLDEESGGPGCPAARALRALAIASIEDALPEVRDAQLRDRIIEFIERRLSDPDLDPQLIADAFGISLRWTHHAFNVDGASLARHIRDRRLDLVAAELRTDRRFPRVGALAERAGFSSRDQLSRAFRARYGLTIAEYATLAVDGQAPEPATSSSSNDGPHASESRD